MIVMSGSLPTPAQAVECFRICQVLTSLCLPIHVVRMDELTNTIAILAGEEIEVTINGNGETEFS